MTIDWLGLSHAIVPRVRNLIGGSWHPAERGAPIQKFNPRDGRPLYTLGAGVAADVEAAVTSSRSAFKDGRWANLPLEQRKTFLYNLAALIEEKSQELALLETMDVGKPITETMAIDIPMASSTLRANAEAAEHAYGKVFGVAKASLTYDMRRPLGVVGAIIGWNFPLVLAVGKIAPALVMGNCVILKPSEMSALSASRLGELALEAGMPAGVLNIVHGDHTVGEALARHRDVDLLTFTGSTEVGKRLLVASGESNMKRLILECGGKAPSIVFDDCPELDSVADGICTRAFWNQGQVCTASSRLLVHAEIKDRLLELLINKASKVVPGDPLRAETTSGPVVSEKHQQKIKAYVALGEQEGAQVAYQSECRPPFDNGFYVPITIFDEVSRRQALAQEEIFGPVLSVMTFRDEQEAIEIANDTIYGLSAVIWTKDLGRAHRVSYGIQAGWTVVNATGCPQKGAGESAMSVGGQKQSGIGVEGGVAGLDAYLSSSTVQYLV